MACFRASDVSSGPKRSAPLVWLTLALGACTGSIDPDVAGEKAKVPPGQGPEGRGAGGMSGPTETVVPAGSVDPGIMPLRRLGNVEYRNTLKDLVGASDEDVGSLALLPDVSAGMFGTNADVQALTSAHLDAYDAAARKLASAVMSSSARRNAVVGCDVNADRIKCTRSFVAQFGRKAYRRPLNDEEIETLVTLASTEGQPQDGVALALRAMLQAPHFLFRAESGVADDTKPTLKRLTSLEIATRLSYLLWGTTPSDSLLAMAEKRGLETAESVRNLATTMLKDPRAKPILRGFLMEWLHLNKLQAVSLDARRFPDWNDELKRSMLEETLRFMEEHLWNEDASFMAYLDAAYTQVDARLAKIYGVQAPPTGGWKRIEFTSAVPRSGLITQPAVLALTGKQDSSGAIWRGKFVRETILCETMPPPPADVGEIKPPEKGIPERQLLEQHRANPACASCHKLLDPVGFGLSAYDATGVHRTVDEFGNSIDDSGSLEGFDEPGFRGAVELTKRLRNAEQAQQCVTEMLGQFLLGRSRTGLDEVLMERLFEAFTEQHFNVPAVVVAFVGSDAFRYRRP